MNASIETSYQPPEDFVEDKRDPLVDLDITDSTELWLIQWPINQPPDFDGKQVSLNLNGDGHIGTFEGSSGKSYNVVSHKFQGPEAAVFLTSTSEAKIVMAGKIRRRVSLIHYPEPSEVQSRNSFNLSYSQRSSGATSSMSGRPSIRPTKSQIRRPSSRTKSSSVSGFGEPSKPSKRKRVDEERKTTNRSSQDSRKGDSTVTSIGSLEHSGERKTKKKKTNGN
ncbi:hypothetical protein OROGR_016628 [Orobanche gracilis]